MQIAAPPAAGQDSNSKLRMTVAGPKLLDQVRSTIRARHYSRRTEKAYADWMKHYIFFNDKRHPGEMGEPEINEFLTDLAGKQEGERLYPEPGAQRSALSLPSGT